MEIQIKLIIERVNKPNIPHFVSCYICTKPSKGQKYNKIFQYEDQAHMAKRDMLALEERYMLALEALS